MARRSNEKTAELIKETEGVLVFKANRPMDEGEFRMLSEMIRKEKEISGVNIVLLPFSCDLVNVQQQESENIQQLGLVNETTEIEGQPAQADEKTEIKDDNESPTAAAAEKE